MIGTEDLSLRVVGILCLDGESQESEKTNASVEQTIIWTMRNPMGLSREKLIFESLLSNVYPFKQQKRNISSMCC